MHSYVGLGLKRRFMGLCVPPLVLALLDGLLTLFGQSSFYWSNHLAVNEANPIFASLLQLHPLAFLLGLVIWMAMLSTMIIVLPQIVALVLSITITFGHTIGSGSWLFNHFELGYQLANGYYLLSACILGVGIRYAIAHGAVEEEVLRVPEKTRWKLGGAVFSLGVLLYLVPWQY